MSRPFRHEVVLMEIYLELSKLSKKFFWLFSNVPQENQIGRYLRSYECLSVAIQCKNIFLRSKTQKNNSILN